jgi:D-alanyl-D-alanine carboxypeptidase (penicillin-binding protein 5/6)
MTKIMTIYTVLKILHTDLAVAYINPKRVYMRASIYAARIGGTTAYIREGLRYSIYDLLCGLMLPSGNDASLVLAENLGRYMIIESSKMSTKKLRENLEEDPYSIENSKICIRKFVKRMNIEAKMLKMKQSSFSNSHGLSDKANKSSALDVTKLTLAALKFPIFKTIVNTYMHISSQVFDYRPENEDKACLVM